MAIDNVHIVPKYIHKIEAGFLVIFIAKISQFHQYITEN